MNVLEELRQRRQSLRDLIDRLIAEPLPAQRAAATAANDTIAARQRDLAELDARIAQLETDETRRQADARSRVAAGGATGPGGWVGDSGDTVYARNSGHSYFADLVATAMPGSQESYDALQRLNQHAVMLERAGADLPPAFRAGPSKRAAGSEVRTNPNRTDGQGGYFVPPLWLLGEYVGLLRAGRAVADQCRKLDLPTGTDSINLPKLTQGGLTASQLDNGAVASRDITDSSITGPVRTIAGQQDVAMQLLDQSPAAFDEITFADLIADYNMQLDLQVIAGTGTSGQLAGLTGVSGINAITYTDATPTVPELYPAFAQAGSQVARLRYLPPTAHAMHPSRWAWITAALDSQNRPLVVPSDSAGMNIMANDDPSAAEGVVGRIGGLPVVVDANIPANLGAGTNQDEIITARFIDLFLFEGAMRTRALVEVLSGTLQVRLQAYNYVAFIPNRYPTAISLIGGTGLIFPSGY